MIYSESPCWAAQEAYVTKCHRTALSAACWSCSMRTWLVLGHLADELLEDRVGENLVALGRDDEGARATDHVVSVIALEVGFQRQDRQAVDDNASAHRVVAGAGGGPTAVVGAIAGNVDDAACPLELALPQQRHGIVDDATDRGATTEDLAWRGHNRGSKGLCSHRILDQGPRQYLDLERRSIAP